MCVSDLLVLMCVCSVCVCTVCVCVLTVYTHRWQWFTFSEFDWTNLGKGAKLYVQWSPNHLTWLLRATLPFIPSRPFALCLLYLRLFFCLLLCHSLLSPSLICVFYLNSVQPLRSHHLPTQKPLPPSSAWLQYLFSPSSCGTIIPFDYVCCGKGIECLYGIWWIYRVWFWMCVCVRVCACTFVGEKWDKSSLWS